jgi:hypothetical protein
MLRKVRVTMEDLFVKVNAHIAVVILGKLLIKVWMMTYTTMRCNAIHVVVNGRRF